jgi:hypothetical protein
LRNGGASRGGEVSNGNSNELQTSTTALTEFLSRFQKTMSDLGTHRAPTQNGNPEVAIVFPH